MFIVERKGTFLVKGTLVTEWRECQLRATRDAAEAFIKRGIERDPTREYRIRDSNDGSQ